MSNSISIDNLASEIAKGLQSYSDDVRDDLFDAIDEAATKCDEEIKSHISRGHGIKTKAYIRNFRIKTTSTCKYNKTKTWYVQSPEYRLTHLLENGHATRNGKRTKAVKHISYGEEIAIRIMEERSEKAVQT